MFETSFEYDDHLPPEVRAFFSMPACQAGIAHRLPNDMGNQLTRRDFATAPPAWVWLWDSHWLSENRRHT